MRLSILKYALLRFRDDTRGSVMVEAVITLPLLVWMLAATYEFFEVHRYKSVREKASYTIADMISREQTEPVTPAYMDNTKTLFDEITNDDGANQIRVSIIQYDEDDDEYFVHWSHVRGTGGLSALTDSDVASAHDTLPIMNDAEQLILVESASAYSPAFEVGLNDNISIDTRVFTAIRFAPKIDFDS